MTIAFLDKFIQPRLPYLILFSRKIMNIKFTSKFTSSPVKINQQSGVALLISIVVMLALTVLALAATNSNQTQAFLVRNAQFRLETFNASFTELDAHVDFINGRPLSAGVPEYVVDLIDGPLGADINSDGSGFYTEALQFEARTDPGYMDQSVGQTYRGPCAVIGGDLGAGVERIRCDEIVITAESVLVNQESILSEQHQVYQYLTLNTE